MSEPLSGRIANPGEGPRSPHGPGGADPRDAGGPGSGSGRPGRGSLLRRWRKAWLVPVCFGAASLVLGLLVLVWPGHTVGALTALFGLYLLITGVYRFIAAIQLRGVEPLARVLSLVLAALSACVGVFCLTEPFNAASSFAVVVGAFWLASGAITALGHWQRRGRPVQAGRTPGMTTGGFSIAVGLLIMLFPGASLVLLTWILGFWLVFLGGSALATGLVARRVLKNVSTAALYWP